MNFRNISAVSRYERKILFRSWFFRIFSIIALLFLFSINMGFFGFHGGIRWTTRAIEANLPYINVLFINVAQAIIAVFLASDFLKRDKKLDTTEVIYTRPVTNGEYVVGKTIGILTLFIGLVVLALLIGLVFNLVRQDVPVTWKAYLFYPLLITLPTLVFIFGLSFLLMIIIRNQAVTFVILLGYIGLTLFYFKDKLYGMLDYMAFNLPMVYSDFIGFGDPHSIILHRLAYLSMGIGFIFATIRFLNRLPQTGRWNAINVMGMAVCVIFGGLLGYRYFSMHRQEDLKREAYLTLNDNYARVPVADVLSNSLQVSQHGSGINVSSALSVRNRNRIPLDTLIFSLNPGFRIDSITSGNREVDFRRDRQILKIIPEGALDPGERFRCTITYSGRPDASLAYLDISGETRRKLKHIQVATIDKEPAIVAEDYLLLTPEIIWYPVAGVGFNHQTFLPVEPDFVRFDLMVLPNAGLIPVAPGEIEMEGDVFHFIQDHDLNALPLVIGPFEKRSKSYGGVEYNLYLKPGHDYFSGFFTHIADTLWELVKEEKDNYEIENLDLYYPFKRINLVETPIQFHVYERPQMDNFATIQPEMILLPEKGAGVSSMDFGRFKYFEERRNRRENETSTPREIEVRTFRRFLMSTFFRSNAFSGGDGGFRPGGGEQIMSFRGIDFTRNPYCVFPLYYSYVTGISSPDFPLFNSMMEMYLKEGFSSSLMQSFRGGMTESETANLALKDHTLTEILGHWDNAVSSALIKQAGSFIFLALKNRVGIREFDNYLYPYLEDHAFREITFDRFEADFEQKFGVAIEPYLQTINTKGKIPAFIMNSPEYIETRDDVGEVYLVRFKLRNTGEVKGLVDVSFRIAGSFGSTGSEQRLYELDPGVTKDIQISLFEQPRMMTVNTLISANIPSTFSTFLRSAQQVDRTNVEEYERISDKDLTLKIPGEYVVDNEDQGFRYTSKSYESKLKLYIDARKEEKNEIFYDQVAGRNPIQWTPVAHTGFYGETVRSAMLTRKGEGENIASWTTELPAAGFYDVYVYIPTSAMLGRPQRGRPGGEGGGGPGGGPGGRNPGRDGRGPRFADEGTVYHYTVSSIEGSEEVPLTLSNPEEGWNKLGTFHFPADKATVELSNKTNGQRVIADAVKWVRK